MFQPTFSFTVLTAQGLLCISTLSQCFMSVTHFIAIHVLCVYLHQTCRSDCVFWGKGVRSQGLRMCARVVALMMYDHWIHDSVCQPIYHMCDNGELQLMSTCCHIHLGTVQKFKVVLYQCGTPVQYPTQISVMTEYACRGQCSCIASSAISQLCSSCATLKSQETARAVSVLGQLDANAWFNVVRFSKLTTD